MEPQLRDRPAFMVMGIQVRLENPMTADYEAIWEQQFASREADIAPHTAEEAAYGVYFPTEQEGADDFVAGMAVSGVTAAPAGLVLREVPAAHEAVFECTMSNIGPTWQQIFETWMPAAGYELVRGAPPFERFPPGCHEGTAPVTIHVPVRKRGG